MQSEKPWAQVLLGFGAIIVSALLILGSLSFSLLEGKKPALALLPALNDTLQATALPITLEQGEPTFTAIPATLTPSIPPPANCPPPDGWQAYDVRPDDTLGSLADLLGYPVETIAAGNCLPIGSTLFAQMILYIPYPASPTAVSPTSTTRAPEQQSSRNTSSSSQSCGRPAGWTTYFVRHGDTLYSIALRYYTTVSQLQRANCMNSTVLRVGKVLYVPNRATRTPYPTATLRPTTLIPPTLAPTTAIPTTAIPPATSAPTTAVPTSAVPPTANPTTAIPPTTIPPTVVPTTAVPTAPPTTAAPTSLPPTTPPTTVPPPPTVPPTFEPPPTDP